MKITQKNKHRIKIGDTVIGRNFTCSLNFLNGIKGKVIYIDDNAFSIGVSFSCLPSEYLHSCSGIGEAGTCRWFSFIGKDENDENANIEKNLEILNIETLLSWFSKTEEQDE